MLHRRILLERYVTMLKSDVGLMDVRILTRAERMAGFVYLFSAQDLDLLSMWGTPSPQRFVLVLAAPSPTLLPTHGSKAVDTRPRRSSPDSPTSDSDSQSSARSPEGSSNPAFSDSVQQ